MQRALFNIIINPSNPVDSWYTDPQTQAGKSQWVQIITEELRSKGGKILEEFSFRPISKTIGLKITVH